MNLSKLENPKTNQKKCRARQEETIGDPFSPNTNLSDIFDKSDKKCPNRPENQELGPILGQNGDPDLIKLFSALLGPNNHSKIKKYGKHAWKSIGKMLENCFFPSLLAP